MKKLYVLLILLFFTMQQITAQTVETFESFTPNLPTFTSSGKTFNLSSPFGFTVVTFSALGYNQSTKFIQVANPAGSYGQTGTINAASGNFKLNNLWLFVSGNSSATPGVTNGGGAGSITFRGKLAGATQFTVVKNTTGANTGLALPGNGFFSINFATEGGTDNTNFSIDQLEIQLSSNYDYFAIDNFGWTNVVATAPTVTTTAATNVGALKATVGGNVTADGGGTVTERGIVWGLTANPTTSGNKIQIGTGSGVFSALSSFPSGTTINYRAYAINSAGTSYGANMTFTTGAPLTATEAQTDVTCFGGSDGTATVTPSGGATPYTYSWTTGATTASVTGLTAGIYTVLITDNEGTSISKPFTIAQSAGSIISITGNPPNRTICTGSNTTFSATAVNAVTYQWQVNTGSGYTNITNGGVYSNATTTTLTITGATAGMSGYTYRLVASGPCSPSATSNGGIITISNVTTSITAQTNVSCFGGSNGSATLSASGGIGPYTYSWSPTGGTAATASGLAAGTYTVTVTDNILCTKTQTVTIAQPIAILNGTTATTAVSCFGGSNGTATVTATGGTPGYTYSWAPSGGTGATASGLTAGTYSVTITDANSCTRTINNIIVGQPASGITGISASTPVSCFGGSNGTASVTASGGTGAYTYLWSPVGGTGASASGLAAGTYSVTITDANACTRTINNIIVGGPAAILNGTVATTSVSCNGGANGTATVTASGGTPLYTYLWSPAGGTAATASGLTAGTYSVVITDANSCTRTINNIIVGQPPVLTPTPTQVNVSCNGGSNGSATVTPTGGAGGYSYLWSNGATTSSITGLAQGNYSVVITDANSCPTTQNFTITQPPVLVASQGTINNVSCNGGSNGNATVVATGGAGGYTYSWSPSGGTGATASGLTQGTYTVTVTDANSCQTTQGFTITEPAPFAVTTSQTDILCNGAPTGSATVNVTGGAGGYTYSWAPAGGTAATASGLTAGTYTVIIEDANFCQTTRSFTITEPSALVATQAAITNIGCYGDATGSASVGVTGGTGAYTYSWAPSGGIGGTASGLTAGTYTVTVEDANLCQTTQSFTITQPAAALSATTASTGVTCFGGTNGTASVTVSGGTPVYTYLWAPLGGTTATISGRPAGDYTCTITDANGCSIIRNITISSPAQLAGTATTVDVSCNGGSNGSATVTPTGGTGGYTYLWSPTGGSAATASGLSAGAYTVTIEDENTCSTTVNVTIAEPAPLSVIPSQTDVLCNGAATGTATVTVSGGTAGYTYSWSPSGATTATVSGLTAGTYMCAIIDGNGCIYNQSFTINEPSALSATTSEINATCLIGGQASVTVSGGATPYTYSWTPSGDTTASVTGLVAGNHSVLITDANGCTLTENFTINTINTLVAATSHTDVLCNGGNTGSATVVPSGAPGPFTYDWSPSGGNADTANNLTAGNYSVTITSPNGCSIVKNFTINEPAAIVVIPTQTNVLCNGGTNGSASVSVTGGTGDYTYAWSPSGGTAATATGLTAGTYTITIQDENLCQTTQSFILTEPAALTATTTSTNVNCNGASNGSATITATGGTGDYTYVWSPTGGSSDTATGLAPGNYTVTVTDENNCSITENITITEPSALTASVGTLTNVTCNGANNGSATVNVVGGTGAYTYVWSPSGGNTDTASGLSPGTYTVTVTDENNCNATQNFTIAEPDPLIASIGSQVNVSCNGGANGSASVNVTGGFGDYTYSWSPSGGTGSFATGLTAGDYTVTIQDENLCQTTQSFTITEPTLLTATTTTTNVNCNGANNGSATITATGGTGDYTYVWSPTGGSSDTATGLAPGNYTVTVTDENSCSVIENVTITEPSVLTATVTQTDVTCLGAADGFATATATGGTGTYNYLWSPSGGNAATATGLAPGNYTVTITDANGCQTTNPVTISTIPDVTAPVPDVTNLPAITSTCSILSSQIPVPTATDNCTGTINGTTTDPLSYTTVGSYVITWRYDDGHGNIATQTQTLNVTASPLNLVTFSDTAYTYDGNVHALQVANLPAGATVAYTITPTASTQNGAVNAGVYTVTAIVSPAATTPNCSPVTLTAQLTINQAAQQITFAAIPPKTLGVINNFNLEAASNSGLAIRYSFTYTSALPPANVSAAGLVNLLRSGDLLIVAHQDGNANYLPAADVSQILVIKNNDITVAKITVGNKVYPIPAKEIKYLMSCDENNVNVAILNETGAIITPSANFTVLTPKPGIYTQNATVTSQDGTVSATYTIIVEKPFGFYDIVHQKFNNVLIVNNNPQTNGGYEFVSYQWFKNGQQIGTGQYYTAGEDLGNKLDPSADYSVKMTTKDGKILQTCTARVIIQKSISAKLYPNPVLTGKTITVEADFPAEELANMQISLYSVSGQLVKTLKSTTVLTEIQLPDAESNMYVVVIETANIKKTLKVIVK
ncbi:T9SS type A sorting domain-containing protein [Flavobacterium sp.]|uniref:T9SS type A sorting domain-containing protein n=1 Tax=Flavobacterium sp. TaxID=239 RepID=UPI003D0F5B5A